MAAERVAREQHDVDEQHDGPQSDPEGDLARRGVLEPAGLPDVEGEDDQESEPEVEEVAVEVLEEEREGALAAIAAARLADRAGRRVGPERLVVGAAVVVAGETEAARSPQDQERGRERHPAGPPV